MKIIGIITVAMCVSLGVLYGFGYIGGNIDVSLTSKSRQAISDGLDSARNNLNKSLEDMKVEKTKTTSAKDVK